MEFVVKDIINDYAVKVGWGCRILSLLGQWYPARVPVRSWISGRKTTVLELGFCSRLHFFIVKSTHQLSPLLGWPGFSQGVHISADGDLAPDPGLGLLSEAPSGVHHQDPICSEPVHVAIGVFPFCCLFLENRESMLNEGIPESL